MASTLKVGAYRTDATYVASVRYRQQEGTMTPSHSIIDTRTGATLTFAYGADEAYRIVADEERITGQATHCRLLNEDERTAIRALQSLGRVIDNVNVRRQILGTHSAV